MPLDISLWKRKMQEKYPDDARKARMLFWQGVQDLASTDVLCYGLWVHGHESPILKQAAMSRHLYVMADLMERYNETVFVCPPSHAKTLLMQWDNELYLGRQTELAFESPADVMAPSCLYVMNASSQAEKMTMAIAQTIEHNSRYRTLFPHVKPDKASGWTKEALFLQRPYWRKEPSFMASGIFGPYQGYRFLKGTMDDPTDQEDVRSPAVVKQQIERRLGVYRQRFPLEGAILRDIFTRWSESDMFSILSQDPNRRCEVMPALGYWEAHPEHGVSERALWPEVIPESVLESIRQEYERMGQIALWKLAYECNPVSAAGNMFKREWFLYGQAPLEDEREEVAA